VITKVMISTENPANYAEMELIEKIRSLPPEKVVEVEDFVDFLLQRSEERFLVRAAAKLSEEALAHVWDNHSDAAYDKL